MSGWRVVRNVVCAVDDAVYDTAEEALSHRPNERGYSVEYSVVPASDFLVRLTRLRDDLAGAAMSYGYGGESVEGRQVYEDVATELTAILREIG